MLSINLYLNRSLGGPTGGGGVETVVLMVVSVENTKYSLPLAYSEVDFTFFLTRSLKSYGYI